MHYAKVIRDAWELTLHSPKLKWFVFVPCFAAVVTFVAEIAWQLGMLSAEFGLVEDTAVYHSVGSAFAFLSSHHLLGWAIFLLVFVVLFEFVFQPWIQSTLILSIRQKFTEPEKRLSLRQRIIEGSEFFFPLFELRALFSPFALMTIAFFTVTMYRYYHGEIFASILLPVILIYSAIAFFIHVFTAFAPYFMVCEKRGLGESIWKSIGLVFLNFGTTMAIILLMLLVNFRVIVNVLVVLGVPLGIFFVTSYFATSSWFSFALWTVILIGVVLLALSAMLTAIVEVFSTAVWERTFTWFRAEQKQLEAAPTASEPPADESAH